MQEYPRASNLKAYSLTLPAYSPQTKVDPQEDCIIFWARLGFYVAVVWGCEAPAPDLSQSFHQLYAPLPLQAMKDLDQFRSIPGLTVINHGALLCLSCFGFWCRDYTDSRGPSRAHTSCSLVAPGACPRTCHTRGKSPVHMASRSHEPES